MIKVFRVFSTVALSLGILAAVSGSHVFAQGCLSSRDARAAAQAGQVLPLSRMLKQIRSAAGGEILPPPQLCDSGGRLVYFVNVLTSGGQVTRLTVDAASGRILGN
jgi:uncharacterized membrane protein YkoI